MHQMLRWVGSVTAFLICVAPTSAQVPAYGNASGPKPSIPLKPSPSHVPLGDYVPCLFNSEELLEMHSEQTAEPRDATGPVKIDDSTAIQIYSATIDAITKLSSQPNYDPQAVKQFLDSYSASFKPQELVGKTPAEAFSYIKLIATETQGEVTAKRTSANPFGFLMPSPAATQAASTAIVADIKTAASAITRTLSKPIDQTQASQLYEATNAAITKYKLEQSYSAGGIQNFLEAFDSIVSPSALIGLSGTAANDLVSRAAQHAKSQADDEELLLAPLKSGLNSTSSRIGAPTIADVDAAASTVIQTVTTAANTVIQAKSANQPYQAPNDVSCSMSILAWKETSDIFGRRVANTYVAIQVTVRNLNNKNEFLIHDIQVAVDTGVEPEEFGRFQAGRDKLLVRAVAQRGQSEDRRNIILNTLSAAGAIAGSASIAGSTSYKDAIAVFQGAFIPGFSTIFPDHTVDQLNHINDLVFSASSTSKVLVPVQGSVPLVTFISEKPIEQLPFAWCGYTGKRTRWKPTRQYCELDSSTAYKLGQDRNHVQTLPDGRKPIEIWDDLPYRNWKAAAIEILEKRAFVVIGGVHIQELTTGEPQITNVDCPTLPSGVIDLSQLSDGSYACTILGSSLDKISNVFLEKATDKVAGKMRSIKDGSSATISFDPSMLCNGSGVYSVFFTGPSTDQQKSVGEVNSGKTIQLARQPLISGIGSPSMSLGSASANLILTGANLDLLGDVYLVPDETGAGSIKGTFSGTVAASDKNLTVGFTSQNLISGKQYHIRYTLKSDPTRQIDKSALTVKPTS